MSELLTVTVDKLPGLAAISADALAIVQEPNGPMATIPVSALLGKLIATDTAKTTQADLYADLAHNADVTGLVFADPTPAKNGWYRKTGASGAGAWSQFEKRWPRCRP